MRSWWAHSGPCYTMFENHQKCLIWISSKIFYVFLRRIVCFTIIWIFVLKWDFWVCFSNTVSVVSRHHKERIEKAAFCSSGAMLIRSSHVSRHNSSRKTLTFCCLLCLLLPKKLTQSWTNERVTTYLMTILSFRFWTKIDIDRLALGPELTMATFSCISFSLIFSLSFSIA